MAEDSSFHHISQCSTGEVFALKLLSSGEKAFFWLQDKAVKAAEVVKHLNSLMTHSNISDICAVNNLAASTPVGEQGKGIKVEALREVLKMDALEPEDLAQIESFLPPGTRADLGSLKSLFKTPYVAKSIETIEALMRSEEAPAFLNQFDLLSSCPGSPYGLAALLQALNVKFNQSKK